MRFATRLCTRPAAMSWTILPAISSALPSTRYRSSMVAGGGLGTTMTRSGPRLLWAALLTNLPRHTMRRNGSCSPEPPRRTDDGPLPVLVVPLGKVAAKVHAARLFAGQCRVDHQPGARQPVLSLPAG